MCHYTSQKKMIMHNWIILKTFENQKSILWMNDYYTKVQDWILHSTYWPYMTTIGIYNTRNIIFNATRDI